MESKKKLKNIANGVLSSFLSRNNDINGYWAIGKLLSLMVRENKKLLIIDLLNTSINSKDREFCFRVSEYKEMFIFKLIKNKLNLDLIHKVEIKVKSEVILGSIFNVLDFQFIIQDINNEKISLIKKIKCREHNPKIEMKSSRNYGNKK